MESFHLSNVENNEQKITTITYDPIKFSKQFGLITVTVICAAVTIKLISVLYENLYEPITDSLIDSSTTDKYYYKLGDYYISPGPIIKAIIMWVVIIIIIMIVYNCYNKYLKSFFHN